MVVMLGMNSSTVWTKVVAIFDPHFYTFTQFYMMTERPKFEYLLAVELLLSTIRRWTVLL
ncbi:hypothetical protein V1478_014676 [Vespula squamosa]|uniref:Uncharacterized protein n=1 Tax=Vespula squamosa TaxID=30214 RepID=A0ABD2A2X3_VESSQ